MHAAQAAIAYTAQAIAHAAQAIAHAAQAIAHACSSAQAIARTAAQAIAHACSSGYSLHSLGYGAHAAQAVQARARSSSYSALVQVRGKHTERERQMSDTTRGRERAGNESKEALETGREC